jgi:hypothetical protein
MKKIFERQAVILQLTHTDGKNGEGLIPDKVIWSLHDLLSGTAIKTDQEITGISDNIVDIEIQSVDNKIVANANAQEERVVSIRSEFAGSSFATLEYSYMVKNMGFWTPT